MHTTKQVLARVALLAILLPGLVTTAPAQETDPALVELGRIVYHEGLLESGEPTRALVAGDVEVDGSQFTCVSCHRRSGMGSTEGPVTALPVTAELLYAPLSAGPRKRPAYDDATLAATLRSGVDPAGHDFGAAMPAYDLPDREMTGLIAYMKTLSTEPSPGVEENIIHFATVVSDGIDTSAMLAVLEQYFEDKGVDTRNQTRRSRTGTWYREQYDTAYRRWKLHTWKLEGTSDTWRKQLDTYYEAQPVFALISGQVEGSWEPVHRFCEDNGIPSILPNTDDPVKDTDGWYTLYFSKGHNLVAAAVADHVQDAGKNGTIIQVYREAGQGAALGDALRRELSDGMKVVDFRLTGASGLDPAKLLHKIRETGADALVLWLGSGDLGTGDWLQKMDGNVTLYLSTTTLGGDPAAVPEAFKKVSYLIHPYTLPADRKQRAARVTSWLRKNDIAYSDPQIMGQTWFACLVAGEGLMHVRFGDYYRDFFMESIEHISERIQPFSIQYPAPSFGPGQRFLSKGCYIAPPGAGEALTAEWVVP